MIFNRYEFDIRCEWGIKGVEQLAPVSDVIIIVDVLSFSTCVEIATGKGAVIFPYRFRDVSAVGYAKLIGAELANAKRSITDGYSLSPASLQNIPSGTRLVLPSPNGSTLMLATGKTPALCGCLRNAKAIAQYAMTLGPKIAVIPAGEQWEHDHSLRPAFEDLVGAGAIISYLKGSLSPESKAALSAFLYARDILEEEMGKCVSGKELIAKGFMNDIELACELNVSASVPELADRAIINKASYKPTNST
jgi:2-phosphosulfolactate phosphatase